MREKRQDYSFFRITSDAFNRIETMCTQSIIPLIQNNFGVQIRVKFCYVCRIVILYIFTVLQKEASNFVQ